MNTRSLFRCLPGITLAGVIALCWLGSPAPCAADLLEDFSYINGNLTTVSGGAWQFWEPGAGDAAVVNGAMRYEGTTDVIRTFPAVLTAPGTFATITFTINVNIADSSEAYAMDFLPASAPFGGANTNYSNQFSLGFDYENALNQGDLKASIDVAEGTGSGTNPVRIGSVLTQGVTHEIRVDFARGVSNTAYNLFLDNTLLRSGTFVLTDPRGMNALELEQSSSDGSVIPSPTAFALIDSVHVVPEPSTCALFLLGCAGISIIRRPRVRLE